MLIVVFAEHYARSKAVADARVGGAAWGDDAAVVIDTVPDRAPDFIMLREARARANQPSQEFQSHI